MRTDLSIPEVLELAASDIAANGKVTGSRGMRVIGPHCILGAIGKTLDAPRADDGYGTTFAYPALGAHPAVIALAEHIRPDSHISKAAPMRIAEVVYAFSDQYGQTEVVEKLRYVAATLRRATTTRSVNRTEGVSQ